MTHLAYHMGKFFAAQENLVFTTENHVKKFVAYIESLGDDRANALQGLSFKDVQGSVAHYHKLDSICSINSLDNHLNALKSFFTYLHKNDVCDDIFHEVKDFNASRQALIEQFELVEAQDKGYLTNEDIIVLLDYFNTHPDEYPALAIFCKLMLLAPAKRAVLAKLTINDFSPNYDTVVVNGYPVRLPANLQKSITHQLKNGFQSKDGVSIFSSITGIADFKAEIFNNQLYSALQKCDYPVPAGRHSFPVEAIRISAILNLALQNVSLYSIAKVAGIKVQTVWKLIDERIGDGLRAQIDEQIQLGTSQCSYYRCI